MKFRKKPVMIEAVQWTGGNANEIESFVNQVMLTKDSGPFEEFIITTLEGDMKAKTGDWIIKGVKGEFYPCKPDIFEATYEAVDEDIALIAMANEAKDEPEKDFFEVMKEMEKE